MSLFVTGFVGGLAIAAPVGPIGMLCIRRSISDGRMIGFACGLGAATADACYGAIAGFGLNSISGFLVAQQLWLQLFGGLALVWIGIQGFRAKPQAREIHGKRPHSLKAAYTSTLLLTLMNPMTILSFLAVFAGLGLAGSVEGTGRSALLVLGVFLGSVAWWLVVSASGGWIGRRLQHGGLRVVNMTAGGFITVLGAWQLAQFGMNVRLH